MKYMVHYNDGIARGMIDLPCPSRLPCPGDIFAARLPMQTLATVYKVGDRFAILGRTEEAPHYRLSTLGNLVVLCKAGRSIWSEFDAMVAEGKVELVIEGKAEHQAVGAILRQLEQKNPQPV